MKKTGFRFLSVLLAACMLLAAAPLAGFTGLVSPIPARAETVASGTCGDSASWTLDDKGFLSVSGTGEVKYGKWDKAAVKKVEVKSGITAIGNSAFLLHKELEAVVLPDSVTKIGENAFSGCTAITSLHLGNSVASIATFAFNGCTAITALNIPASLTSIGAYAFKGCAAGLTSITGDNANPVYIVLGNCLIERETKTVILGCRNSAIPTAGRVTAIGRDAFSGCAAMASITVPKGVVTIGSGAFERCTGLTGMEFPDSLTTIGNFAFGDCTGLTELTIPNSVTRIVSAAFRNCTGLTSVTLPESLTEIENSVFSGCTALKGIALPETLTGIGNSAFENCVGFKEITLPESLERIDFNAFAGCSGLTEIHIPKNVTHIGDGAFLSCPGIASVSVDEANPVYHSIGNCVIETAAKKLVFGCKNSVIPDDGSVTSLECGAFYGCAGLTALAIPECVTEIGANAVTQCASLMSIQLPEGVTTFTESMFDGCSSLTAIHIPKSVTAIDCVAFDNCTSLAHVYYAGTKAQWQDITIDDYYNEPLLNAEVHYSHRFGKPMEIASGACGDNAAWTLDSDGLLTVSGSGEMVNGGWDKTKVIRAQIKSGITAIGDNAFSNHKRLTEATLPSGVTSIGKSAFYCCNALVSADLPKKLVSIGEYAFSCCMQLASVSFPKTLEEIGESAYYYCYALTELTLPEKVTAIPDNTFEYCTSLSSVTLPKNLKGIGSSAFQGCDSLTAVTIPKNVDCIGEQAFAACPALVSVTVDAENPYFHSAGNCVVKTETKRLVFGCNSSVIPADGSVTSIGNCAFYGCSGLTSITLPEQLADIGASAFFGCKDLTEITVPEGVSVIYSETFSECEALASVALPVSITYIGDDAFLDCVSLTDVYYAGTEDQWDAVIISESFNEPLLNATVHYEYKPAAAEPIDAPTAKELGDYVYAAPQTAAELLGIAGEGAALTDENDDPVTGEAKVGSGMTLTKTDGAKLVVIVKGDNDGDGAVTAGDARFALRVAVELETPNDWQLKASLVESTEKVTAGDARLILRAAVGLETLALV